MKRILILMLVALMATGVQAKSKQKAVVAYFSASGVTAKAAKELAEVAKADLFEIAPITAYTEADLDWRNQQSRSSIEMKDKASRPTMKNQLKLAAKTKLYLGFPIWWGTCPRIVNTFIESQNLKGREVVVFVTSGSQAIDVAMKSLREQYPNINWVAGKRLNNATTEDYKSMVK